MPAHELFFGRDRVNLAIDVLPDKFAVDRAGADAVAADLLRGLVNGYLARELQDATLGSAVAGLFR